MPTEPQIAFMNDSDQARHEAEQLLRAHALCTDECPLRRDARKMIQVANEFDRSRGALDAAPHGQCQKKRS